MPATCCPIGFGVLLLLASTHAGNYDGAYADHVTALKAHLFASYDKSVVPRSERSGNYSNAGTDVAIQIRFFKIDMIDPLSGAMRVKIWLRMSWTDTRLSWNPSDWGNVTYMYVNHPLFEEPEIWTPDITPYNDRETISDTFPKTVATVQHSGEVFWSRPGMLDVRCPSQLGMRVSHRPRHHPKLALHRASRTTLASRIVHSLRCRVGAVQVPVACTVPL